MTNKTKHLNKPQLIFVGLIFLLFLLIVQPVFTLLDRLNGKDIDATKAKKTVTAAYLQAEKDADDTITRQIKDLSENGIIEHSIASSKTDVCYFVSFEASPPLQKCYIRYIEGFTTNLDLNSILARRKMLIWQYDFSLPTCSIDHPEENGIKQVYFRDSALVLSSTRECETPNQIRGRIIPHDEDSVSIISSFNPKSLDYSRNHIWIVLEKEYYTEELLTSFPFGGRIRKTPITAK